jgi:signal transduction histidine kinase
MRFLKKKYKDLSVTVKVPLMMGIVGCMVLSIVCLLVLIPLRSNSLRDSSEKARLYAEYAKEHLNDRINGSANVIRAYSGVIAQLAASEIIPKERKREFLMAEMKALFDSDIDIKSMWCILEPDALDGMDDHYIHRMGSNSQGVFAPRFVGDTVVPIEILTIANLYAIPKMTELETITAPEWQDIDGKMTLMFGIGVPVMLNGKFLGVIAIDYHTEDIIAFLERFNSDGRGKLITDKGIAAVHYRAERIGRRETGNREIMQKLTAGKMFEGIYTYEGEEHYTVYVPIRLSKVNNPWFFAVEIPASEIYAGAHAITVILVISFLTGMILIAFAGAPVLRPILNDIVHAAGILHQLSFGRLNQHIEPSQSNDEIGKMKTELHLLIEKMKLVADFARQIGEGNLDAEYQLLSEDDVLGGSLLEMREKLRVSDQIKSTFLANFTHEVRAPLSGIMGLFTLLSDDPKMNGDYKKLAHLIRNSGEQLLRMINDILDASKMEAGEMVIHSEPVCLNTLLDELYVIFTKQLQSMEKSKISLINLENVDAGEKSLRVNADPVRLRQILNNLLSNATKFTEKGYIRYGYRVTETDMLEFFVEDTGIGIPESHLDVIFRRFRQVEFANRRQGGTGLGLSISRNLAQLMGGDLYVTSAEGEGSKFTFTVAYHPCETN